MSAIIPAILPTSLEDLTQKLQRLRGLVTEVQIDSVDGKFISPGIWPYTAASDAFSDFNTENLSIALAPFRTEVDLMVHDAEIAIAHWVGAGACRVVVHAEASDNLALFIREFQEKYGHHKGFTPELLAFGLAINIDTDLSVIEPYLDQCDFIQFMGIAHIGRQGEPFDPRVLHKISVFHAAHPDMVIQVDGGVSLQTAPDLLRAGASRLIIGSGLWKAGDLEAQLKEFNEITQMNGWYT
jgi:ribulose-phosphate 3-epimerase